VPTELLNNDPASIMTSFPYHQLLMLINAYQNNLECFALSYTRKLQELNFLIMPCNGIEEWICLLNKKQNGCFKYKVVTSVAEQ